MKRILFLHDNLEMGGAEKLRLALLKKIDRSKYNIRVCCINNKGVIGEEISKLGIPVDELRLNPSPKNIFTTVKIAKYLHAQNNIDILHTSLFNANYHGRIAGFLCRIPKLISEVHGQHYEFINFKYLPHIFTEHMLYRVSNTIICCSDSSREDIINREKLPAKKIVAITNCIDPADYQIDKSKENIRDMLGIGNELVLITAASFWRMKGHIYLLKSLFELKQLGYVFKWICAGDGPIRNTIQRSCADLQMTKEVIFLGRVSNVADYLNASDLFILPSLSEALSIALLEAMYLGLPCIVTDVGANRELIEDRVNGIVVKHQDKEALKKAILCFFGNRKLIEDYGSRNKQKIINRYIITDNYLSRFYEIWN